MWTNARCGYQTMYDYEIDHLADRIATATRGLTPDGVPRYPDAADMGQLRTYTAALARYLYEPDWSRHQRWSEWRGGHRRPDRVRLANAAWEAFHTTLVLSVHDRSNQPERGVARVSASDAARLARACRVIAVDLNADGLHCVCGTDQFDAWSLDSSSGVAQCPAEGRLLTGDMWACAGCGLIVDAASIEFSDDGRARLPVVGVADVEFGEAMAVTEIDWYECVCGNSPHDEGLFPCDADGHQFGASPEDWPMLYGCASCGRIADALSWDGASVWVVGAPTTVAA